MLGAELAHNAEVLLHVRGEHQADHGVAERLLVGERQVVDEVARLVEGREG